MDLLPISPPAGSHPPESGSTDEKATLDHIGALLTSAQEWLDLLDMPTGVAWNSIERALDDVGNLGAGT